MDTRTIGELRVLTPDLDPRDLDKVDGPPEGDLMDALVDQAVWPRLAFGSVRMSSSYLVRADLSGVEWSGTALYGCRFERVDLSGARLATVTIERCEFVGCRMTGVHLTDATLKNVIFEDCRLDYAVWSNLGTGGPVAVTGCRLDHAALRACDLSRAAFRRCQFDEAELVDCDLRGADLRGSGLAGIAGVASLRGAVVDEDQLPDLAAAFTRDLVLDVRTGDTATGPAHP